MNLENYRDFLLTKSGASPLIRSKKEEDKALTKNHFEFKVPG